MIEPDKTNDGWEQDGRIHWVRKAFPEEVELLLFNGKTVETDETSDNDKNDAADDDWTTL